MEFLEGSRGIYRPIRVLFDTPIYDRALQLCWHISSYKSQIALVMELLRLQQKNLIPSQVTTEDMINLILEKSKNTIRERLWEFELEGFDEEDAKPLLMLVWAVNISNKMRDVEFEAQMLLNSPQALPPNFQHPKVLSVAQDYAKILREKKQEAASSKLLCPQDVLMEVVPRVLQGFWILPPRPLLNMPSMKLSKLSTGVTKAVLDGVSNVLPSREHQATFSRSIRDDMVLSILTEIRETYPHDILVNRIKSFAPVLLSKIVDVAVRQICGMFQSQSPKVSAHLTPDFETPATTPVWKDFSLPVTQEKPTPSPETNSAVVPAASSTPSAEPASTTEVQARENDNEKPRLVKDPKPTRAPDSAVAPAPPATAAEPASVCNVHAREDETEKSNLNNDPKPSRASDSAVAPASLGPLMAPPHPAVITAVQDGLSRNLAEGRPPTPSPETNSSVVFPPPAHLTPPTKALDITDVQGSKDKNESPSIKEDPKPTRAAVAPASLAPLNLPLEPVIIVTDCSEVKMSNNNKAPSFIRWLLKGLCCRIVECGTN